MKTAISIPDTLFRRAEQLARRLGLSRSRLFCLAVEQLLARHADQQVAEALDRVYGKQPSELEAQIEQMQAHAVGDDRDVW